MLLFYPKEGIPKRKAALMASLVDYLLAPKTVLKAGDRLAILASLDPLAQINKKNVQA